MDFQSSNQTDKLKALRMDMCSSKSIFARFSSLLFFFPYFGLLLEFILKEKKIEKGRKINKADGLSTQKKETFPKTD